MSGLRVLIVDDEEDILELLDIWFSNDDRCASVDRAVDLDLVVEQAAALSPDAIVLDFWFGARMSVEVLPSLRQACPQATIVIHTASERAALSENALALGADAIIEKAAVPIDEVVARVLDAAAKPRPQLIDLTTAERTTAPRPS